MGKRVLGTSLILCLLLSLLPASAYAMTGKEAVDWTLSQVGTMIGNGQCTRLIEAYTWQFFGFYPTTSPKDYPSMATSNGWEKIRYYPGFIPAPGDIAIWEPGRGSWGSISDAGHTAIIISATETQITSVDQNYGAGDNGSAAQIATHTYDSFWGVLRPPFNGLAGHQIPIYNLSENDYLYTASVWAREGVANGIAKGFVSIRIGSDFTNVIGRAQFCRMAIGWLEYKTGKDVDALLAERGLSRKPGVFSDTDDTDVLAAYALGITSGTSAPDGSTPGLFTPNGAFTREQAAAMIRNTCIAAGIPIGSSSLSSYEDIRYASNWAVDGIHFCYANGILTGTSIRPLRFSPKMTFTRQESIIAFARIK